MAKPTPEEILKMLDLEQQAAVKAPIGPLRIIAGAGTGKTRTLIHRIAYWDSIGTAPAEKTLSVTHSNKSASELRHRLKELGVNKINAQTLHAAAKKQLQDNWSDLSQYWKHKGYRADFPRLISDTSKNRSESPYWIMRGIAQSVLKRADLFASVKRSFDRDLNQAINFEMTLMRARMTPISTYESKSSAIEKVGSLTKEEFLKCYRLYTKTKKSNNQIDFADLLELCILMLKENPKVSAKIQNKYEHFLVDEYQDNDPIQNELLSHWIGNRNSICVVGDPRQTIYSFKGSEPSLLNDFSRKYPHGLSVELIRNYRSTPQIVSWANSLMRQKSAAGGAKADLISFQAAGPEPKIIQSETEVSEPIEIAQKIQTLIAKKSIIYSQIAILLRMNTNIPIFRQSLKNIGIPTKSPGDTFWEDVLPIIIELQSSSSNSIPENGLERLVQILEDNGWRQDFIEGEKFDFQKQQRLDNAEALVALANTLSPSETQSAQILAENFQKMREEAKDDHNHDAVTVTTIHKAKGLEWDAVLIPKFIEGVMPISYAKLPAEIDEERRLAYVAITRARKFLLISWASKSLNSFGNIKIQSPSRFLSDLEKNTEDPIVDRNKIPQKSRKTPVNLIQRFKLGDKVNTKSFGLGRVVNIQGDSITVNFGTFGIKQFKYFDSSIEKI